MKYETSINDSSNNKRIAKNTLLLYFRMLLMMVVTLYTSRVVLATLGVEDYGIYNVVGGVVTMFGFISGCMSTATQRYLTFELGKGRVKRLQESIQCFYFDTWNSCTRDTGCSRNHRAMVFME